MAYPYVDARESSRFTRPPARNPPVNHTRRSWTSDGVHYTMERSNYSSPTLSFELSGASFFHPTQQQPRSPGTGILGAAFGLLGDVISAQQQQQSLPRESTRRSTRPPHVEDLAFGDDEGVSEEGRGSDRPRGIFSKVAERLLNNPQSTRQMPRNPDRPKGSAPRRQSTYHRANSSRNKEREPSWADSREAYVEDSVDDEDEDAHEFDESSDDDFHAQREAQSRRTSTTNNGALIEALENAKEHHRRSARNCRKRLEQVTSQRPWDTPALQSLSKELRGHERAYESALSSLALAKDGSSGSQHQASHRPQSSQGRRTSRTEDDESASAFPPNGFDPLFQGRRTSHPMFTEFEDFHAFQPFTGGPFAEFERFFNVFGTSAFNDRPFSTPTATFTFPTGSRAGQRSSFSTPQPSPQFQRPPWSPTFPVAQPRPPANLLTPEEAKKLFRTYNERWTSLSPTDSNIAYPSRGLRSSALGLRDTIWAPQVSSPVSNWSEEAVMQANTQAFFLGAVGLSPVYAEAPRTGTVVMSFSKPEATPAQVKELVDILKKEKARWHSDRLGRRNGAMAGTNETLQRDERARAVFHAVCELMQIAQ